jgi:phosphoglycolate phosphatase-like HAD superfamily hydrolase
MSPMRHVRPLVLLFDIDGTLLDSGGAGRRAIDRAFERLHGRRDACASFSFGGMTDRAIARAGLVAIGAAVTAEAIDGLIAAYLEALAEELPPSRAIVHAGVEAALDAASASGAAVGLGTGNVRPGARLKLARVGLAERFAFGGFGCDHEVRSELLRAGVARGAALLGAPVAECRMVIIGDTPKDVAAAQAIGAESLAVATGPFSMDALAVTRPTWLFRDLSDPGALDALLG